MSTKSRASWASSDSTESCQRAAGSASAHTARRAGFASVAATISQSARARHPGRWPCTATLPRPRRAPRLLVPSMTSQHYPEGLVEDGETLAGQLLGDDEGRIDPDRRGVGHRDEAAPEALLVEVEGDLLVERPSALPVLHQLDTEEQAAPAHFPDGAVLLPEAPELREQDRPHPLRVRDQVFLQDDLERGEAGRGGERVAPVARRAEARVRPRLGAHEGGGRDHAREGKAAAHSLAHRH